MGQATGEPVSIEAEHSLLARRSVVLPLEELHLFLSFDLVTVLALLVLFELPPYFLKLFLEGRHATALLGHLLTEHRFQLDGDARRCLPGGQ